MSNFSGCFGCSAMLVIAVALFLSPHRQGRSRHGAQVWRAGGVVEGSGGKRRGRQSINVCTLSTLDKVHCT